MIFSRGVTLEGGLIVQLIVNAASDERWGKRKFYMRRLLLILWQAATNMSTFGETLSPFLTLVIKKCNRGVSRYILTNCYYYLPAPP